MQAQQFLTHNLYKESLFSGSVVRVLNTKITSKQHVLQTETTNKVALSSFDNKRYIMEDGVTTLPFGHCSIREEMFNNIIAEEKQWGENELFDGGENSDTFIECMEGVELEGNRELDLPGPSTVYYTPPDPGLIPRDYSESELNDCVDFDRLSHCSEKSEEGGRNPFILFEADEVSDNDSDINYIPSKKKKRKQPPTPPPKKTKKRLIMLSDSD